MRLILFFQSPQRSPSSVRLSTGTQQLIGNNVRSAPLCSVNLIVDSAAAPQQQSRADVCLVYTETKDRVLWPSTLLRLLVCSVVEPPTRR